MKFGKLKSILPLPFSSKKSIALIDGTLNNNGYYFLNAYNSNIILYDNSLNSYRILPNNIFLSSLCYDSEENCLWGITKDCHKLCKFSLDMSKIYCILINNINYYYDCIKNIAYNENTDSLILTSNNKIFELAKNGNILSMLHNFQGNYSYLSSYYLYNNIISLWCYRNFYYISILDSNKDSKYYQLPNNLNFKSIIFSRYIPSHNTCLIYLLADYKNNSNKLICVALNNCYINLNLHFKDNKETSSQNSDLLLKYNNYAVQKFIKQQGNNSNYRKNVKFNFKCHHHKHYCDSTQSKCTILCSITLQETVIST